MARIIRQICCGGRICFKSCLFLGRRSGGDLYFCFEYVQFHRGSWEDDPCQSFQMFPEKYGGSLKDDPV